MAEPNPAGAEHFSADGYPVTEGRHFWTNDLRVAEITEVGKDRRLYADTGEYSTWHKHTDGSSDTLTGRMRQFGRLARFFGGLDAEEFPAGTDYKDVKGR
jgi:hypothetical protein